MNIETWVVLYSRSQDAYHVETLTEYRQKGAGPGKYRVVAYADSFADGVRVGRERREKEMDK